MSPSRAPSALTWKRLRLSGPLRGFQRRLAGERRPSRRSRPRKWPSLPSSCGLARNAAGSPIHPPDPRSGPLMATESFGPSALATPANAVTIARLLVTPVMLAFILADAPSYPALAFWVVLSCTDGLDGWIARRQGTT